MRQVTRGHIVADAGVQAAIAALNQIDKPGRACAVSNRLHKKGLRARINAPIFGALIIT
jgi:hypothetical protein